MCTGPVLAISRAVYTFASKLENSPCAPANPHGTDLLEAVLLLQSLDAAFNLGESNLLGVTSEEWREEFLELQLAALEVLQADDFALETGNHSK